ncbi:MAG: PIN domain-containing protein [Acidobacteria bacterium]|nr:PIN domain-containing protein [Acidobacteriota bacterium]
MKVLVDTSVWSLAFRRTAAAHPSVPKLQELILDGRATITGAIRQELLSGIKISTHFDRLRERLRAFPDIHVDTEDHEEAARYFNRCRSRGLQGSNTDFLLCAIAGRRELPIFTDDKDFALYAEYLPISLF